MAIGQTRTVSEGLASTIAKIKQNPFQFALAILLVMTCASTKKVCWIRQLYRIRQLESIDACRGLSNDRACKECLISAGACSLVTPWSVLLGPNACVENLALPRVDLHGQDPSCPELVPRSKFSIEKKAECHANES